MESTPVPGTNSNENELQYIDMKRVFISYTRDDINLVKKIKTALEKHKIFEVLFDQDLSPGHGFHEQIKDYIATSHIFMPLITEKSDSHKWVHQEIGYAIALNIPVLPITTKSVDPGGLLQTIQALKIDENADNFEGYFNKNFIESVLDTKKSYPLFVCAHLPEERAILMVKYAEKILKLNHKGLIRQKGGLSSFHIPDACILDQAWNDRYYPETRNEFHKRVQRNERLALEKHAFPEGCRLIITPAYAIKNKSIHSARSRLNTLIQFLENKKLRNAVIGIQSSQTEAQSLTIVGNWFLAESVSFRPGDGFTNTFFTHNTTEINQRIEDFDCELCSLLKDGWNENNSREKAIEKLKQTIAALEELGKTKPVDQIITAEELNGILEILK
jgi:hypothetical protein